MTRWKNANPANLGAAAELIVAAEFALSGYQVFRPLVDDRGVDLLIDRGDGQHLLVQVKSSRMNYVFMRKKSFPLDDYRALALLVYPPDSEQPELFVIPAAAWRTPAPPLVSRDYDKPGLKSPPEWGVNFSTTWRSQLAPWRMKPGDPLPTAFAPTPPS